MELVEADEVVARRKSAQRSEGSAAMRAGRPLAKSTRPPGGSASFCIVAPMVSTLP